MLRRLLSAGVTAAVGLLIATSPASAGGQVDVNFDQTSGGSTVTIGVENPGSPGGTSGGSGGSNPGSSPSGKKSKCTYDGAEFDCTSKTGVWSSKRHCFVKKVSPRPDPASPAWDGHTDGAIYQCTPPGAAFSAGGGTGYWFWAPDSGEAGAPELVDPVTLAERAVERMDLVAPAVGMTPLSADVPLLVGMDAWLWVDGPKEHAYGPITRSATAGSTTVEATARVTKAVWNMGDGTTVTCRSAGTRWTAARGTGASPTCGHRYESPSTGKPHDSYTVRVTTHWRVDWSGGGQSGRITFTMSGQRQLEVTELQVLQTS